jgi:hypothetical protein
MYAIVVLVLTTVLVAAGEIDRRQGRDVARRSPLASVRAPRAPRAGMIAMPASP